MICMTNLFMFETPDSKGLGTWVTESITAPIRVPHVFFFGQRVPHVSKGRKRFYGLEYIFAPKGTPIGRDVLLFVKKCIINRI